MKRLFIYITLWALSFPVAAKIYYVKPDGNPNLSGSSWSWATNNLQAAIDRAVAGDEVYVAVGTYSGGFVMKEGVKVLGGYTANNSTPAERYLLMDVQDNPAKQSILDGGGSQRVLTQYAPFAVPTTWEGFVIQNGSPAVEFKVGSVIYPSDGGSNITGVLYQYNSGTGEGKMIGREEIRKQWGGYCDDRISPACPSGIISLSATEAKADLSGQQNTAAMICTYGANTTDFTDQEDGKSGNYAAYWCDTLTAGGYGDWYLPSAGEMQEIYDSGVVPVLKSIGKDLLHGYWTSSYMTSTLAWSYHFGKEYVHPALKYRQYTVSAVHAFSRPTQPGGIYYAGGGAFLCANGVLENCIITHNVSPSRGGGVYVSVGGKLVNCIAEGNEAPEGKEIYYEPSTAIQLLEKEMQSLTVYPNPVKAGEVLSINGLVSAVAHYQFVNAAGQTVMRGELKKGENTLIAPAQKGIYVLSLQSNKNQSKSKIIIQ